MRTLTSFASKLTIDSSEKLWECLRAMCLVASFERLIIRDDYIHCKDLMESILKKRANDSNMCTTNDAKICCAIIMLLPFQKCYLSGKSSLGPVQPQPFLESSDFEDGRQLYHATMFNHKVLQNEKVHLFTKRE